LTVPRALIAGLLLGFCFGVSMKTILLLLTLLVSAVIALLLVGRKRLGQSWRHLLRCTAAFIGAVALVPGAIGGAFAVAGLWHDFRYYNFDHNLLPQPDVRNHPPWWIIIFPITFPLVIYAARRIVRAVPDSITAFRRVFIFLICGFYVPALHSFWNLHSRQDYLPLYSLAFALLSGPLLTASSYLAKRDLHASHYLRRVPLPAFVA